MLVPGPTKPVAVRAVHSAGVCSRSAPSTADVTSWPRTSPFGSDGACGICGGATFGASATRPVTTLQRSFTGVISDGRSGLLLSRTERSLGRSVDSLETSLARALRNDSYCATAESSRPTALRLASSASGSETVDSKRSTTSRRNRTIAPSSGVDESATAPRAPLITSSRTQSDLALPSASKAEPTSPGQAPRRPRTGARGRHASAVTGCSSRRTRSGWRRDAGPAVELGPRGVHDAVGADPPPASSSGREWRPARPNSATSVRAARNTGRSRSATRMRPGSYRPCRRPTCWATDAAGNVQPDLPPWNRLGHGNNAVEVIYVDVR